jgi:hypothetical protein
MEVSRDMIARVTRSVGIAAMTVLAAVVLAVTSTISTAVNLLATTVLAMTGTFTTTPYPAYLEMVQNQYVTPALGTDFDFPPQPVTTPEQAWPITGLFDHTFGTSVRLGVGDLEGALDPALSNPHGVLVFGYSQSSVISIIERRKLERYYAAHPELPVPNLRFMCIGCLNLPNGGVMARYAGGYLPIINFYFNGAASADTPFPTTMVTNRWDGFADSPLYPLWLPSTLNGVLGMVYAHTEYDEWTLSDDYEVGTHGNTTYYFLPNEDLPLFGPLRTLGVPEDVIDVFEPFVTQLVELGYDRTIPPWEPTRARLIPRIDPFTAIPELLGGINEGIDNAFELIGGPADVQIRAPQSPPQIENRSAAEQDAPAPAAPVAPQPPAAEAPQVVVEDLAEAPPAGDELIEDKPAGPVQPKSSRVARPQLRGGTLGTHVRDVVTRGQEALRQVFTPRREPAPPTPTADADPDPSADADAGDAAS